MTSNFTSGQAEHSQKKNRRKKCLWNTVFIWRISLFNLSRLSSDTSIPFWSHEIEASGTLFAEGTGSESFNVCVQTKFCHPSLSCTSITYTNFFNMTFLIMGCLFWWAHDGDVPATDIRLMDFKCTTSKVRTPDPPAPVSFPDVTY